jgi:hypothetical protein
VAQSFNVFCAQLAKFAVPGTNSGRSDVVLSRDVIDRGRARFAQDFHYLTFSEFHFPHGYLKRCLAVVGKNGKRQVMVPDAAQQRFVNDANVCATSVAARKPSPES